MAGHQTVIGPYLRTRAKSMTANFYQKLYQWKKARSTWCKQTISGQKSKIFQMHENIVFFILDWSERLWTYQNNSCSHKNDSKLERSTIHKMHLKGKQSKNWLNWHFIKPKTEFNQEYLLRKSQSGPLSDRCTMEKVESDHSHEGLWSKTVIINKKTDI